MILRQPELLRLRPFLLPVERKVQILMNQAINYMIIPEMLFYGINRSKRFIMHAELGRELRQKKVQIQRMMRLESRVDLLTILHRQRLPVMQK